MDAYGPRGTDDENWPSLLSACFFVLKPSIPQFLKRVLTSLRSLPGKGSNRETEDWNDDEDDDDDDEEEEEANLLSPLLSRCYGTYVHLACQERQRNESEAFFAFSDPFKRLPLSHSTWKL